MLPRRDFLLLATQSIHDEIRRMAQSAPLAMRFAGGGRAEAERWQREFRARLDGLLGDYRPPERWKATVRRKTEFADHTRQEMVLTAEGHRDLPLHLLTPSGGARRRPGVLALHGHGAFGHDAVAGVDDSAERRRDMAQANYDFGRQLARRGYVVAAPCFTPFGERLGSREEYRGEDPCAVTFVRLQLLGKLLLAENLRDALWAGEALAGHDQVDAERIGCVGLSLGGRMTMMTAAVSPRVRVAVISGALNMLQERVLGRYSCGAQVIPGLLRHGDVPEISSLIAPRPCLFEVGRQDKLMVPEWIPPAVERMKAIWTALGAKDNLDVDSFDGGHRWNGVKAYPLLEKVLQP